VLLVDELRVLTEASTVWVRSGNENKTRVVCSCIIIVVVDQTFYHIEPTAQHEGQRRPIYLDSAVSTLIDQAWNLLAPILPASIEVSDLLDVLWK
jgi:hypothetical protein